jgi:hypothetical protein
MEKAKALIQEVKANLKFQIHDKETQLDTKMANRVEYCKKVQGFKKCSECKDRCLIRKYEAKP